MSEAEEEFEFVVFIDGEEFASGTSGDPGIALLEAQHYASQCTGRVEGWVERVTRERLHTFGTTVQ